MSDERQKAPPSATSFPPDEAGDRIARDRHVISQPVTFDHGGDAGAGDSIAKTTSGYGAETTSEEMSPSQKWWALDFAVAVSIRYHAKRRSFFESLNIGKKWLTAMSGAAIAAALFQKIGSPWYEILGFLISGLSLADLAIDFSRRARMYEDLGKRFNKLHADMTRVNYSLTDDFHRQRLEIERDEPEPLYCLSLICHNEEAIARGYDDQVYKIPTFKRYLRHFYSFEGLITAERVSYNREKPKSA